jgi:threonyl-tRNA synthetase
MNHHPAHATLDHRTLGREMGLYATHPDVGSGLPLWLPAGAVVRDELEAFARDVALASGCERVASPVLAKKSLFERSGHWTKFHDDMFPPMVVGGEELVLRPANCPHHALTYAATPHSHHDLPVRYSELAPMFRSERSGVLSGLSRVRQINLDDAHVFCRPDQVREEVRLALEAVLHVHEVLGTTVDHVRLSRRGDRAAHQGSDEQWADAEAQLRAVLDDVDLAGRGIAWVDGPGEAAFYGPKLDVQVADVRGHVETLSTVQLDFTQPERFDLTYAGADGRPQRVVMVHRGVVGSMERMVAFLLELHQGRLPLWLAPVQVCALPVGPVHARAAENLAVALRAVDARVRVDGDGSLGARIRASRRRRDALIAVVGDREVAAGSATVTDPRAGRTVELAVGDLVERVDLARRERSLTVALA